MRLTKENMEAIKTVVWEKVNMYKEVSRSEISLYCSSNLNIMLSLEQIKRAVREINLEKKEQNIFIQTIPGDKLYFTLLDTNKQKKMEIYFNSAHLAKNHDKLIFDTSAGTLSFYYSFSEKCFKINNRQLKNNEFIINNKFFNFDDIHFLLDDNFYKYEWFFNYNYSIREIRNILNDNILSSIFPDLATKMPKNLSSFLTENNCLLTVNTLYSFIIKTKMSKEDISLYEDLYGQYTLHASIIYFLVKNPKFSNILKKLILNDFKKQDNFSWAETFNIVNNSRILISLLSNKNNNFNCSMIDLNRGLTKACETFQDLLDEKENEILNKQLTKLSFLNNFIEDNYIIKIPTKLKDLQEEGKNQNNCVGSYYNDSIKKGKNLIFFIRHKDSPEHSYITCRYSVTSQMVAEFRYKNNQRVTISEDIAFIKSIENIINSHFNNY